MEEWAADILKVLGGGLVTLVGLWLAHRVQQKAAATQEKQVEVNAYLEVGDKWKEWAEKLEGRVESAERKADDAEEEVAILKPQVSEVRGLFNTAIMHIKELRSLIVSLGFAEQLIDLPDSIAHLIEEVPNKKAE